MINFTKLLLKQYNTTIEELQSLLETTNDDKEQQDNEEDE